MAVWYPNSAIGITFSTIRPIEGRRPWSWHSGSILDVEETWPRSDEPRNALRPEPKSQFFRMKLQERFLEGVKLQMDWWHESHEPPKNLRPKQIRGSRCSVDFPQITEICERFIKSWWLREIWRPQNMVFDSCVMTTVDVKRYLKSQTIDTHTPLTQACAHYHMKNSSYKSYITYTIYLCLYFCHIYVCFCYIICIEIL